jgi:hypothetical protein
MPAIPLEAEWLGGVGGLPGVVYERGDGGCSFDADSWDIQEILNGCVGDTPERSESSEDPACGDD